MRRCVLLLLLFACKRDETDESHPRVPKIAAPDDTCDPSTPKVCVGPDVVACEEDGHLGRRLRACHDGCKAGKCKRTCDDEAVKVIYATTGNNDLLKFDPRKLPGDPFTLVGKMNCENEWGSPFSMSVDRGGFAWVVYQSGSLYKVSIEDATCENTVYSAGSIASTFGMGFVTDKAGSSKEHLYLAKNDYSHDLVAMDTEATDLSSRTVGKIAATEIQNPELTGTGEGRLFGFYPVDYGIPFVQEIDKSNGAAIGERYPISSTTIGDISAYAFAHWAGSFYVFATINGSNNVFKVDPSNKSASLVREGTPWHVTGAGVSTCAPEKDGQQTAKVGP